MTAQPDLTCVTGDALPAYPFSGQDRLDSHYFLAWERQRWLNSDMCINGTPECRAYYFDLINIAHDQSPIGTLPVNRASLAKLVRADRGHFEALCDLPFGPLHKWVPCLCDGGEVRLMHPMVLKSLQDAFARRQDNRARNEAANTAKRLQRLRINIAGYSKELSENDAAIRWMDEWLVNEGCGYRTASWHEKVMAAWAEHVLDLRRPRFREPRVRPE